MYVGVTNNIIKRIYEHKNNFVDGFTKQYNVHLLVHIEETNSIEEAIKREKLLKRWKRQWKLELINKNNPKWKDLYSELLS